MRFYKAVIDKGETVDKSVITSNYNNNDSANENIFIAMSYTTQCVQGAPSIIIYFINDIHFT